MIDFHNKSKMENSLKKIKEQLPDKDVYNGQMFQDVLGQNLPFDFTRKSLKRINVKNITFDNTLFKAAAGTGSKFTETNFNSCDFSGSNFQDCYFNNCHFSNSTLIEGANFSNSTFIECCFENIIIRQSTLYDCHFENCSFISCLIYSDTTENSLFYNCCIKDIDMAHLNLEYIKLQNIQMENVKLPPYQIPYIIGGPTYIRNTTDEVFVYTDNNDISNNEYAKLYEDLAFYYHSQQEYFPLSNILIALEQYDEAIEYIKMGIQECCDYFDFRMIKHFCRLACSCDHYSPVELKEIYNLITNLSYNNTWDLNTLHSYMLNIGNIRELLLNNSADNQERVDFVIKTNIEKDDLDSINALYNEINILIKNYCSDQHIDCIELRHNSPYELFITCIDSFPYLISIISSIYSVLATCNKFIDVYKNFEDAKKIHNENQLHKYIEEEKKLDIELKKLELEKGLKNKSPILTITEIEHNITCNTLDVAKAIDPDILHYRYKN